MKKYIRSSRYIRASFSPSMPDKDAKKDLNSPYYHR